ncbi:DNA-methyltransferase [Fusobacterium varium]
MIKIMHGNSLEVLKTLEDESIDCVVTSPPYWQIRDYGVSGQIGLERDVNEFLDKLINVFNEIYRVLKKTGTLFVNMGDTYSNVNAKLAGGTNNKRHGKDNGYKTVPRKRKTNIKRKSKMMIPERLAIMMVDRGCPEGGIVLDPFLGSGTTLKVAKSLNMHGIGIELKKEYIDIAVGRIGEDLFTKIKII